MADAKGWGRVLLEWVAPRSWFANAWWKLLSLFLAVCTWLYVQAGEVTDGRIQVQLDWTLPNDLVSVESLPTVAYVTVRGTRATVNKGQSLAPRMSVDVSGLTAGTQSIQLDPIPVESLPTTLERLSTAPSTVEFELQRVSVRRVEIEAVIVGEPASGRAVEAVTTEPRYVEVRGARSLVNGLRKLPTRPLDVTSLSEDQELEAPLDLPPGVELVEPAEVRARVSVSARTERRSVRHVPVYVWGHADWVVEPAELAVEVEGPASRVAEVSAAELAAFVHLPPTTDGDRYEVSFGPTDGPRISVLERAGTGVVPVATEPASVVARKSD